MIMEVTMNQNGHKMATEGKRSRSMSELEKFDELFPVLVDNLTKQGLKDDEITSAMKWFKRVLEYNVPHGKKNRGLTVVQSYRYLVPNPTDEDIRIAQVIGWCTELLQAFFLVADDVMDHSITRRGQPCWYRNSEVGLEAINDSFYLESAVYVLLKKYCKGKPYYTDILELFHETTMQTVTGQCLDMMTATVGGSVDFSSYSMDRYKAIVKWKTAFYSFYLPVAGAMHMAGTSDEVSHASAKTILLKMGEYFQIQDDYLDCYGDPKVTGKVGTDIQDNKCSWFVVQALQRSSPEQRSVLEENYAVDDPEKIAAVKSLYGSLQLEQCYRDYEENSYAEIQSLISKLHADLPAEMFHSFVKKIYKREK